MSPRRGGYGIGADLDDVTVGVDDWIPRRPRRQVMSRQFRAAMMVPTDIVSMSVNIGAMSVEKSFVRGKSEAVFRITTAVLGKSGRDLRITGSGLGKCDAVLRISRAVSGESG